MSNSFRPLKYLATMLILLGTLCGCSNSEELQRAEQNISRLEIELFESHQRYSHLETNARLESELSHALIDRLITLGDEKWVLENFKSLTPMAPLVEDTSGPSSIRGEYRGDILRQAEDVAP